MKLKWLSLLLALALVFSLAPAMALAEEVSTADALQNAIKNTAVTEIKLTADEYDLSSLAPFTIDRNLTIICEGDTAIFRGDPDNAKGAFIISGDSDVTLQGINFVDFGGNTTSGNVIIAGQDGARFGGTLNITNCSFSNFSKNGITVKGGRANITGGTINVGTTNNTPNRAPNGIQIDHGATATISGCKITNSNSTHGEWSATGILTLRGGITTASNITFENCESAFHVTKGYDSGSETTTGSSSSITNSTFKNCKTAIANDTGETIGGNGGTWTPSSSAALSTEVINQLPEDTTIKLTEDVQLDAMLNINTKGITLDLNGYTITASELFPTVESGGYENDKHLINVSGKNVTIENGTLKTTEKNKHALNVYGASEFKLKNMTLDHTNAFKGAPMVVNGSSVTVSGTLTLKTGDNSWYGMNIDNKVNNVATDSRVNFADGVVLKFEGPKQGIFLEHTTEEDPNGTTTVSVTFGENVNIEGLLENGFVIAKSVNEPININFPQGVSLTPIEKITPDGKTWITYTFTSTSPSEPQPPTPPTSGGGWDDTLWPNILQHPQSVSAPAGSLATFSVVANGGPLSYQWQVDRRDGKGFVSIPGATGATLTVGPVTGAENGYQYRCAVTLYGATMYSGAGQLFVTAGMIPKTGDMPGSPALLLALAGLGLAALVVARRRAG